jgi:hypothetical protein
MSDQTIQWEYRVLTIGNDFTGAKDEQIEQTLNDWGLEGWEAINVYAPTGHKVTLVAKKPLTAASRRLRSMP